MVPKSTGQQRKKHWPTEAVIIVCATPETAVVEDMESVHAVHCRECRRALAADGRTIRIASDPRLCCGRPIEFLCLACAEQFYEVGSATHVEDHRGGRRVIVREGRFSRILAANAAQN